MRLLIVLTSPPPSPDLETHQLGTLHESSHGFIFFPKLGQEIDSGEVLKENRHDFGRNRQSKENVL